MMKLALFPLNTVLFPGMPLSLHIFEDRYKEMISRCLEDQQPFGVVLIEHGVEALGPVADPYPIGCTAQIAQIQPLNQGRMNLVAVGEERFRILSLNYDRPYLSGTVEIIPLRNQQPDALVEPAKHLRGWVERYLETLAKVENLDFDLSQLPNDPLMLANLAAFLVQVPAAQKQALLAASHAAEFMQQVRSLYRREVTLLDFMTTGTPNGDGIFSYN